MKIAPSNYREQRQYNFVLAFALLHYISCVHTLSLQSAFLDNEIQNQQPFSIDDGVETINEEDNEPMMVSSQSNVSNWWIGLLFFLNLARLANHDIKLFLDYILGQFAYSWGIINR